MTDKIADMLVRIRNAQMVQKRSVVVPYSDIVFEILGVLKDSGFIQDAAKRGRRNRRVIDISLLYGTDGRGRVQGARRISKQSRRIYAHAYDLRSSRKGPKGAFVVSTSRCIMSSSAARKAKVGGEVLCEVW